MPRPCDHPTGPPSPSCHICKLWLTRADYRALWGGPAALNKAQQHMARLSLPCVYLGEKAGRKTQCLACGAQHVDVDVFRCEKFGECTKDRISKEKMPCCSRCAVRNSERPVESLPDIQTRNLLYHICPLSWHSLHTWQKSVASIVKRWSLFNGKKVVAIAKDPAGASASDVRRLFPSDCQIIEVENDPSLREVASFLPLFSEVETDDPHQATLYAHSKGVTRAVDSTSHTWADLLSEANLDYWPVVEKVLSAYPLAGCFKKNGRGWPNESASEWHYSGSWFWFRNKPLFSKPDWKKIDRFWSGIESYPSLHFGKDEAGVIFCDGKVPDLDLYSWAVMRNEVLPKWDRFKARNADMRNLRASHAKVELGGGANPRPGFVNIDQIGSADIKFDFESLSVGNVLPLEDDSVDSLYTSHCLEHIKAIVPLFREILRICKIGATVEIRVPHWFHSMAMCSGHVQVIAPDQITHWTESALDYWCGPIRKKLTLSRKEYVRGPNFQRWRRLLPDATENDIEELCPDACHESRWTFVVERRP